MHYYHVKCENCGINTAIPKEVIRTKIEISIELKDAHDLARLLKVLKQHFEETA